MLKDILDYDYLVHKWQNIPLKIELRKSEKKE